jgi:hypothetical protein
MTVPPFQIRLGIETFVSKSVQDESIVVLARGFALGCATDGPSKQG